MSLTAHLGPGFFRTARGALDFLRLIDEKGREDKVFLLAGSVAFNLILAFIPLMVITITATASLLGNSGPTIAEITGLLGQLIPVGPDTEIILRDRLRDVLSSAPTALSLGTVAFIWLSTRLFASLRLVLSDVFDIEETRNILAAKLFDIRIAVVSAVCLTAYFALSVYLALATSRGLVLLDRMNVRAELMGEVEALVIKGVAFVLILAMFFLLYRYLPCKRIRWRTAAVAALFTSVMFEVARYVFGLFAPALYRGSLYSGIIAALVVAVIWSYYVSLVFILGGEVSQVVDLLRARRIQRVVFE
jgi:membrane protein